jgi:alkanesulfonate monooxygenase SsuD/methylene tetrahydromethanopterin reductase-like flavin-dependent oxidoreductase (luciferase family)
MLAAGHRVDALGYDHLWVWDHLLPVFGDSGGPIFEGTTSLAALAATTQHVRLGLFVAANTLRNPGLLAKAITTIDHISDGRAICGIGAGWYGLEHAAHGVEFGSGFGERLDWLADSVSAVRRLLDGETVTLSSGRYRLERLVHRPRPVQAHVPILIGGAGERRTLRIVAEHGDIWNIMVGNRTLVEVVHKNDVLNGHCAAVGRDPTTIERSLGFMLVIRDTEAAARRIWAEKLAFNRAPYEEGAEVWLGNPRQIADRICAFRAAGFDTFMAEIPSPYDLETIDRLIGEVKPLVERTEASDEI